MLAEANGAVRQIFNVGGRCRTKIPYEVICH